MNKKIVIIIITIALILGIVLSNISFEKNQNNIISKDQISKNLEPLECNLSEHPCKATYNSKEIEISLSPTPIQVMTPLDLSISGLDSDIKDLNVRFNGVNMDMGTIKANLKSVGLKHMATVTLSACVISVMRYELAVYSGDKDLNIKVYFDVYQ
ncbi:MAG: hypothetical protein SPI03_04070 [Campylobacter sputorum]|uniref:hypothetical protein n=1 Tax=Campylobacter sputorum TaxID=206 RepID=UPI00053C0309|nr:hypothetical protein [Campylobacter sputorum]ASM37183.1 hypothetical protein CSF_1332 [Campylobacter sputorum bv. faecalis CCUG 20703]ASM38849.1 hypothetical protein CSPARA_1302 [Campylobacter sputorum bv. paraureolyticus LMG 11764]MDY6120498.1 hypothetical protein [Campylobacter sputorum]